MRNAILAIVTVVFSALWLWLRKRMSALFYIIGAGVMYGFVATLAKVVIVRNRHFLNHARGVRSGLAALERFLRALILLLRRPVIRGPSVVHGHQRIVGIELHRIFERGVRRGRTRSGAAW